MNSNSNKTNANVVANNDTNNENSIHPAGTPPPRSPSLTEFISSQLIQRIFPDTPPFSYSVSPADSTSIVEFLVKVPPLRSHYYFHHGIPIHCLSFSLSFEFPNHFPQTPLL